MKQRQRRIFVYRPDETSTDELPSVPVSEPRVDPGPPWDWPFSPTGAICAWLLSFGLMLPAALLVLVTLRERHIVLLSGFGLWLLFGLIVVHWRIPSAGRHTRSEGIAASGWHVALSLLATGGFAWLWLFEGGLSPSFTLDDTRPVVVAGGLFTALSGLLVLWARGHAPARTVRYAVFGSSILVSWMALWLVAAHGGL